MSPNSIGWLANIFFSWGVYAIGEKNVAGFYANIVANLLYAVQGVMMGLHSLVILSILLTILNIRGIKQWKTSKYVHLNY